MVKLNIDENPEIAQQMRIQSIPAVYAFKDGRPVDGFVGALPESQVKQFVQRLGGGKGGPSPVEEALAMAKEAMQTGDDASAGALYSQILQREPTNVEALAGLARAMIARGELAKAKQHLDRVPGSRGTRTTMMRAWSSPPGCSGAATGKWLSTSCWPYSNATANGTSRPLASSCSNSSR
jgi:putative thioredoxin